MSQEIQTISLGGANCYLVKTDSGHILVDTGFPFQRSKLEEELERKGCMPGNLKLIVITHVSTIPVIAHIWAKSMT